MMGKHEWNRFWRMSLLPLVRHAHRVTEEHWRISLRRLLHGYPLEGADILELGCGSAKNSFTIFREYGCNSVTLVDYNEQALLIASRRRPTAEVHLIQADVMSVSLRKGFGLVHSSGLVEHFYGDDRRKAVAKHSEHAKLGGLVMLWVPRSCLLFKLLGTFNKTVLRIREKPFRDAELLGLCGAVGLRVLRLRHKSLGTELGILAKKCERPFPPDEGNWEPGFAVSPHVKEGP